MKLSILTAVLVTGFVAGIQNVRAADEQKEEKAKPYPIEKCIVSDEKLGEMGAPVSKTYNGQEIKFCCKDCIKKFDKEPDKYLKKLADAQKKTAEKK